MVLDVVVAEKSGPPLAGLQQQDFTILDNQAPQTITSFKAVSGREADLAVILMTDPVNASIENFVYSRTEVAKFLRADEGHLAYPTLLATFMEKGVQTEGNFSRDGNALAAALDRNNVGPRSAALDRSAGVYGQEERLQLSLRALDQIVASTAQRPGRKLIIWLSPGWPFMAEVQLDPNQQQQIFKNLVWLTDDLLEAQVTLYSVDSTGASGNVVRDSYYKQFLKGVTKPGQVYAGNVALQVLAVESGGLALPATNDIAGAVRECLKASMPYYEISFAAPASKQAGEYHRLEIQMPKAGLIARTLHGYYAQPEGGGLGKLSGPLQEVK
jgi:VWFA-related protein